jgi:hypothetical protein
MTTKLTIRTNDRSLWLCFEPWATEHTVPPDTAIVIHFPTETYELTHHPDGITFLSFGQHPDLWTEDDTPVEIYSAFMPETPNVPVESFRNIMTWVPPVRTEPPQD